MLKRLLLPALLLSAGALTAQDLLRFTRSCSYKGQETAGSYYTFEAGDEADRIVEEICKAMSLPKNFVVKSANVTNALACTEGGQRYILYSTLFLEKFKADAGTRWAAYSVLAHEIGHHLCFHDFKVEDPVRRKKMELEADGFAGGALRLLGATLDEAKSGVETFAQENESNTHPPGSARREAIARAWTAQNERLLAMGLPPVQPAATAADADGDGVPDATDRCPSEIGPAATAGCPDADADQIADADDRCPYQAGPARWQGCPDTDGDDIPDHQDKCRTQPGPPGSDGCPPADRDRDGVADAVDKCPDQPGPRNFQGCPDTDTDGVPDNADKCPSEKGLPALDGCPEQKNEPPAEERYTHPVVGVLVKVNGGKFQMGCTAEQQNCGDDEKPVHEVTLSDYYIGEKEITQAQWRAVMGSDPPELYNKGCDQCPVEGVSWDDVQEFLKKLNARSQGTGTYRLPTEAEWEYAARGGRQTKNYQYAGGNDIDKVAWYYSNYKTGTTLGATKTTHPVGTKAPNELGLYDMTGNVWEWCSDWYGSEYYKNSPKDNPADPSSGSYRVYRGGSWRNDATRCRVADRGYWYPANQGNYLGFRLAASSPQ